MQKNNPFLIVLLGDLNAKLSKWYKNDSTSYEGTKIDDITSQFGMQPLIIEPAHILPVSSSCFDLIFVFQPTLEMELGVHSSLHQKCHHQIIYAELNLKIHYQLPYEREICHYKYANTYPMNKQSFSLGKIPNRKDVIRSIYLLKQLKV